MAKSWLVQVTVCWPDPGLPHPRDDFGPVPTLSVTLASVSPQSFSAVCAEVAAKDQSSSKEQKGTTRKAMINEVEGHRRRHEKRESQGQQQSDSGGID